MTHFNNDDAHAIGVLIERAELVGFSDEDPDGQAVTRLSALLQRHAQENQPEDVPTFRADYKLKVTIPFDEFVLSQREDGQYGGDEELMELVNGYLPKRPRSVDTRMPEGSPVSIAAIRDYTLVVAGSQDLVLEIDGAWNHER